MHLSGNLGINGGNVLHQVNNTGRVTVFVIVPGNKLDEVRVEHDTGTGIKDGGANITLEIGGDKWFVAVSEDSLHGSLRLGLDHGADLFVSGGLLELAGQVDNRHINGWDTESHSGDLSLEGRDDLGNGLGGSGGRRDDVAGGSTSSTPVLAGRRINNSLCGGHGVDGGHEGFSDDELIMDGLDHRGKSVGGAGCARDEVLRSIVFFLVDTHDNGLGIVLGRSRVDDLLGTSINDGLGGLLGEEDSGGLADVVSTKGTPTDFLRITAAGGLDFLSSKDKEVSINLNSLAGLSVDGVVLVLVRHVVWGGRTSVDGGEVAASIVHDDTGHETSNTSESVDSHAGGHGHGGIVGDGGLKSRSGEA